MKSDNFIKITNAVYELLDFLPESDPLKNRAKEKALAILENLTVIFSEHEWISLKKYLSPELEKIKEQTLKDIEVLENYLKVARKQKWVSDMNFLIIANSYNGIKSQIKVNKTVIKEAFKPEISKKVELAAEDYHNSRELPKKSQVEKPKQLSDLSLRQEKILKILSNRNNAQVSDIIEALPNVTKRTIRRDLDDLLKKKKIARRGQWNQVSYQLA